MDTKSKYLLIFLAVVFIAISVWKYYVYFVVRDYTIFSRIPCDPAISACFASICPTDEEGCEIEYYLKIEKNASQIPECTYGDEECNALTCEPNEKDCLIISCTPEIILTDERCSTLDDIQADSNITDTSTTTPAEVE